MRNKIILLMSLCVVSVTLLIMVVVPLTAAEEVCSECNTCAGVETQDAHSHDEELESVHDGHVGEYSVHELEAESTEGHDGHEHEDSTGEDHAGHEEGAIHLTADEIKLIGIQVVEVAKGEIPESAKLTGQVQLNDDRLAHISALTPGIVRQVNKSTGDSVSAGEVLAWLESVELGQAKVEYLDILAEVGCCKTLLDRAQNVKDNTIKLIGFLRTKPTLDELKSFEPLEMGEYRSKLVKSYAEFILAGNVYDREKKLFNQKISSQQEYLDAENALKKAEAEYIAVQDISEFQVKQDLLEEATNAQRMELALKGAERKLYVLGQDKNDIKGLVLTSLVSRENEEFDTSCPDPDCEECKKKAALVNSSKKPAIFERLGWYPLRAPFDGTIIEKHITLGERLGEDRSAFTVADLKTVWIDLDVFPNDQAKIFKGQKCLINTNGKSYQGSISFVSPVLNAKTRTATARVVIGNNDYGLRPGQFVNAEIYGDTVKYDRVVPRAAVQTVAGRQVVFVSDGEDYEMKPVILGYGNSRFVEIVSGVNSGEKVVSQGAFDLKAKVVTSTLDSHAGHGH